MNLCGSARALWESFLEWADGFKESLVSQLEGITVVEPDGSKHKIEKKIKS